MKLLIELENVLKALRLAAAAHSGQVDKAGEDYIKHPIAVAGLVDTEELQIVALLHDVVEDTSVTFDDLKREGFDDNVISAVDHLTHRENESREGYLSRVLENPLAATVKLADLMHNSDLGRIKNPTEKDLLRTRRYKREIDFLRDAIAKGGLKSLQH